MSAPPVAEDFILFSSPLFESYQTSFVKVLVTPISVKGLPLGSCVAKQKLILALAGTKLKGAPVLALAASLFSKRKSSTKSL